MPMAGVGSDWRTLVVLLCFAALATSGCGGDDEGDGGGNGRENPAEEGANREAVINCLDGEALDTSKLVIGAFNRQAGLEEHWTATVNGALGTVEFYDTEESAERAARQKGPIFEDDGGQVGRAGTIVYTVGGDEAGAVEEVATKIEGCLPG